MFAYVPTAADSFFSGKPNRRQITSTLIEACVQGLLPRHALRNLL